MDKQVIYNKVENLRNCLSRIESKKPISFECLLEDYDLQDVICLNIERAVQLCVDIATYIISETDERAPETMRDAFDALKKMDFIDGEIAERMKKAVGFRNIAVHTYKNIDWNIVLSIVNDRLTDFKKFAQQICKKI